jgi:DNA-binding transcriptional ArsR family regulator
MTASNVDLEPERGNTGRANLEPERGNTGRTDPGSRTDGASPADPDTRAVVEGGHDVESAAPLEEAIELLSDEYACRILCALDDRPMPARELSDACGMSRPTVYRRLDRLEAAGLVTAQLAYDPDGHHRKRFHLALEELEVRIGSDGVSGRLAVAEPSTD